VKRVYSYSTLSKSWDGYCITDNGVNFFEEPYFEDAENPGVPLAALLAADAVSLAFAPQDRPTITRSTRSPKMR
jgi:hypothetical protein